MTELALEYVEQEEANRVLYDRYVDKLTGLERDLVNIRADVKLAKESGNALPHQEQRVTELEAQIRAMRGERDKVKPKGAASATGG